MIGITRKASPLVAIVLLSFLLTMMMPPPHLPLHQTIIPMTDLTIVLALVNNMMPVCHVSVTNMVSAMTPMLSNGLNVKCTTLQLVHRGPKISTICTSPHNPPNLVQLLLCPLVVPICRHTAIVTLTPLITLVIGPCHILPPEALLS